MTNPRLEVGVRTLVETSALETSDSRILLEPASLQYIYIYIYCLKGPHAMHLLPTLARLRIILLING